LSASGHGATGAAPPPRPTNRSMNEAQITSSLHAPVQIGMRGQNIVQSAAARLRSYRQMSLAPVWCVMALLAIATAWLLPNHAQPWLAFHSDSWMAVALSLVATVVLLKTRELSFSGLDLIVATVAAVPMVQYAAGLLSFAGQAWTSSAYLLGLLLAILVGRQWNAWRPLWMGDILFGSFLTAGLVSVGLQLYQWMGLTADQNLQDIWVYWLGGHRPYGNLAQPNQMATLLLWGLIGCGWSLHRGHVRRAIGAISALILLLGLALTQSRTGLLGLCAIAAAAWWWRKAWAQRTTPYFVAGLVPLYFVATSAIAWGTTALLLDTPNDIVARSAAEIRPALWAMFLDAMTQRPWLGYGWNEGVAAHLAVAERHLALPMAFGSAHNLALDLALWAGIPIALGLVAVCLTWASIAVKRVRSAPQVLYALVLLTVGLHAMLEFPLNYAYFLLPAGLAVGALSGDLKIWLLGPASRTAWRLTLAVFCASVGLLAAIVYDYFHVESATLDIRMKMAAVHSTPKAPDVLILTQFPAMVEFALRDPAIPATEKDLQQARHAGALWMTQQNLSKLIVMLALNGHVPEARCWMVQGGALLGPDTREFLRASWPVYQETFAPLRSVAWPPPSQWGAVCDAVKQAPLGPFAQLRW
jgi:hypothetical protein